MLNLAMAYRRLEKDEDAERLYLRYVNINPVIPCFGVKRREKAASVEITLCSTRMNPIRTAHLLSIITNI
jgi:hypothetical protein